MAQVPRPAFSQKLPRWQSLSAKLGTKTHCISLSCFHVRYHQVYVSQSLQGEDPVPRGTGGTALTAIGRAKAQDPRQAAKAVCEKRGKVACPQDPLRFLGFDSTLGFPGEGPQVKGKCNIYFANITSWSDKAVDYLLHKAGSAPQEAEIFCVAEHHLVTNKLKGPRKQIDKAGRFSFITSATPTGLGGSAGGTMVLPRKGMDISKVWGRN